MLHLYEALLPHPNAFKFQNKSHVTPIWFGGNIVTAVNAYIDNIVCVPLRGKPLVNLNKEYLPLTQLFCCCLSSYTFCYLDMVRLIPEMTRKVEKSLILTSSRSSTRRITNEKYTVCNHILVWHGAARHTTHFNAT